MNLYFVRIYCAYIFIIISPLTASVVGEAGLMAEETENRLQDDFFGGSSYEFRPVPSLMLSDQILHEGLAEACDVAKPDISRLLIVARRNSCRPAYILLNPNPNPGPSLCCCRNHSLVEIHHFLSLATLRHVKPRYRLRSTRHSSAL